MTDQRPTVLILFHYFGGEAGATGPTQSILAMIRALSDRYSFRVIAEALPGDEPGRWTEFEGIPRLPLRTTRAGVKGLRQAINDTPHDVLLASSYFDPRFTILPLVLRKIGALRRSPMLVAPRGEFNPGALKFSRVRKRFYIAAARALRLLGGVSLQATTAGEVDAIRKQLSFYRGAIHLVPNIRTLPPLPPHRLREAGKPLTIAFLSRIDKMKNLHFAIDVLKSAGVPAIFNIYGPVFSTGEEYWRFCQSRIAALPEGLEIVYRGAVDPALVIPTLAEHDLFFLPTLGESFGHAIIDSLIAGTPVLLSDRTPWRGLAERGAGWDLPLSQPESFVAAIRHFASIGQSEELAMRAAARSYAETELKPEEAVEQAIACFETLLEGARRTESGFT